MNNTNRKPLLLLLFVLLGVLLFSACGTNQPLETQQALETLDPCSLGLADVSTAPMQALMREFDDTSFVAQRTPRDQLAEVILALQETRRKVEDLSLPVCLLDVHQLQIIYMNAVITTFSTFLGGADIDQVQAQTAAAREFRSAYDVEIARLLGVTPVPTATMVPPPENTPTPLPTEPLPSPTDVPVIPVATSINGADVRAGSGRDYAVIGYLDPGQGANIIDRSQDGEWIHIEYEGTEDGSAWVLTSLVDINVAFEELPISSP